MTSNGKEDLLELLFASYAALNLLEERVLNTVTDEHAYVEVYGPAVDRLRAALENYEIDSKVEVLIGDREIE